jgi:hypothetical protein
MSIFTPFVTFQTILKSGVTQRDVLVVPYERKSHILYQQEQWATFKGFFWGQ